MTQAITSARLGNQYVASVTLGQSPPSSAYNETGDGLPFFQGKVDFGLIHPTPRVWCNAGRKFAKAGDVLISVRAPVGEVNVAKGHCAIGRGIAAIRPGPLSDPWFLYFALLSAKPVLERMATGSTFASVNSTTLNDLSIPFLEKSEQSEIGLFLRSLVYQIEQEEQALHTAQSLKRAAMHTLFTRGLRGEAQKETEIGLIPEGWAVSTLGESCRLERGRFMHRPRNEPRFYGGPVPFVQTGDVVKAGGRIREFAQTLNEDGVAISHVFPAGTILITIAANIGFTGILQFDSACPDSLVAVTPDQLLNNEFLEYFLQTQQEGMDKLAPKGTQKNINIQFLKPWPVVVPPQQEQREVVAILDAIDRKIHLHRRKRAVLEELFKSLLHKLMTGEIAIGELNLPAPVED